MRGDFVYYKIIFIFTMTLDFGVRAFAAAV